MAIEGKKLSTPPIVELTPVKNLFAKTTLKPLPELVDWIGVDFIVPVPDSIYLFSTLEGKETSKPNSLNFIFSFVSTEIRWLLNSKDLALKVPLVKFKKSV